MPLRSSRWLPAFFLAAILLPPVPFPIGDSGFHFCILLAALGLFAGLLRPAEWSIEISGLNFVLSAFVACLAMSVSFALEYSGWAVGMGSALRVALFAISVYVYLTASQGPDSATVASARRTTRLLFYAALAAAAFGCIDFFFQLPAPAGFGPQFIWLDAEVLRRAQGLFYEASTLGNFCAFFLVVTLVALTERRDRRMLSIPTLIAGLILFSSALLLSYSRASLLNVFIAACVLVVIERKRFANPRVAFGITTAAVAAIALLTTMFHSVMQGYISRLWLTFDSFAEIPDRILSGRLESWRSVLGFLAANPFHAVFGIGYKTLPYTEFLGKPVIADNMYLSMLAETGIFGLLALILLNAAILITCARALRSSDARFYATCLLCFWAGETVQMLSGDILTYWRVLPIYFWMLAVVTRLSRQHENPAA